MKYAGWQREKLGEKHLQWNHNDSNTEVELYRYGVKSYVEVRLGTRRIDLSKLKYEYSSHDDARKIAYALLDSIQAGFQTSERLEEEDLGQYGFQIEKDTNQRMDKLLEMEFLGAEGYETEDFFDYMNNLLNFYGTNHYFEGGSGYPDRGAVFISVYKEEPFSISKEDLNRQRRKLKQSRR